MTDDTPDAARRALERHGAFAAEEDGYQCTTTPFDAVVTAGPAAGDRNATFEIAVELPTLDAVVSGESVADVVEDGWYDTLRRRLQSAYDVAGTDDTDEPELRREGGTVLAKFALRPRAAEEGVADAKAIVDFVEGTYVQGIIPGYEYDDPAARLLHRARRAGDAGGSDEPGDGAERGGTPL